jgi:hypothetical protein
LPDQLFSGISELPFQLAVDHDDRAVWSDHEDTARKRLRGEPEQAVGLNSGLRGVCR